MTCLAVTGMGEFQARKKLPSTARSWQEYHGMTYLTVKFKFETSIGCL